MHKTEKRANESRMNLMYSYLCDRTLEISVSDDGQGVASTEVEQFFFAEHPRVHALALLRRRLQGLFGESFQLEVRSEIGEGTTVTMRIPLRKHFGVNLEAPRAITPGLRKLALE
jgi:LytS/YehU family sensor histidine kinase